MEFSIFTAEQFSIFTAEKILRILLGQVFVMRISVAVALCTAKEGNSVQIYIYGQNTVIQFSVLKYQLYTACHTDAYGIGAPAHWGLKKKMAACASTLLTNHLITG